MDKIKERRTEIYEEEEDRKEDRSMREKEENMINMGRARERSREGDKWERREKVGTRRSERGKQCEEAKKKSK